MEIPPVTEIPSVEPNTIFKLGDSSSIITGIQSRLMSLGYMESDEPSEYFGYPLETAVKLFQRANNMTQTGEVDNLLLSLLYSESPAQYVIEYGNIGNDVAMVQDRLNQLGYYSDKINGYYGTATLDAVEVFQAYNGLDVSGRTDGDIHGDQAVAGAARTYRDSGVLLYGARAVHTAADNEDAYDEKGKGD